jgi:hypothetical protein
MGPVAVLAASILILSAPLMRGGNRNVALIGLESVAALLFLALWLRAMMGGRSTSPVLSWMNGHTLLLAVLLLSPAWLALVYLIPLPAEAWAALPGRHDYPKLLSDAGMAVAARRPLSLVPDATQASLLSGSILVAGFLTGYLCRLSQLKFLLTLAAGMAFLQVLLGLLQFSGGGQSSLYFDGAGGRPFGTFANPNHFANYIAMALAGFIWLAWSNLNDAATDSGNSNGGFGARNAQALWIAGGLLLVIGILISRSRGAALSGLPAAAVVFGMTAFLGGRTFSARVALALLLSVVLGSAALIGIGSVVSRFDADLLSSSAEFRALLSSSTMQGTHAFWPLGAGWGTYADVYPRFQPASIAGYADDAHQDYAQMLFEGGAFALILMCSFLLLAAGRTMRLVRALVRHGAFNPDEMAAAACGIGLAGFLVHSLGEFNMHIPANAALAAMLAGAFLRPLRQLEKSRSDRPT